MEMTVDVEERGGYPDHHVDAIGQDKARGSKLSDADYRGRNVSCREEDEEVICLLQALTIEDCMDEGFGDPVDRQQHDIDRVASQN